MLLIFALCVCPSLTLAVPTPTRAQADYQRAELIATVGFQMDTYAQNDGDPGCNSGNWNTGVKTSSPSTLAPTNLNTTQWAEVLASYGAKYAWMDAKHGCGFLLWPTKTKLPNGEAYGYDVGASGALGRDVVREFKEACEAFGISPGYYYSLKDNFYMNVHEQGNVGPTSSFLPGMANATQAQFEALSLAQLRELWTNYGSMSETWFDGGWASDMTPTLKKLIAELLPDTAAFGGFGVSPNPVKWVGTESGLPTGPIWSMGDSAGAYGQGSPNGTVFIPTGCDTVMMTPHTWFAIPGMGVRSLADLISSYHATVGNNCVLELGFATLRSGLIPDDQVARAKELGDWIRSCYGKPVVSTAGNATHLLLHLPSSTAIDRVVLQEDITFGQRVRSYEVDALIAGVWKRFSNGSGIGHKRIDVVGAVVLADALRLTVSNSIGDPIILNFAAFSTCPAGTATPPSHTAHQQGTITHSGVQAYV